MVSPFRSQTRASAGGATSGPTALINPSRITMVAFSRTSPGLITTLPPANACTPSGNGRNPGGSNSALSIFGAKEKNAVRNQIAGRQAQLQRENDGRGLSLIRQAQYAPMPPQHKARKTLGKLCSDTATS